jgi:LmbE family N-acetylglucosaminyl deacetylase
MVIVAHPDDPEFFCGGTIARWVRDGVEVVYLILTNGNKGSSDPSLTPQRLTELRAREQERAAEILGVRTIVFLGEPDGELQPTLDVRRKVVREIRRHRPEVVICPDPAAYYFDTTYVNHPDHRAAGVVALEAVFPAARNRMYHPELLAEDLAPHAVHEIYLTGTAQPNRWIDITDTIETKLEAIRAHASQIADAEVFDRVRQRAEDVDQYGRKVYREAFHYLHIR